MSDWPEYATSLKMRDAIKVLVQKEVNRIRPDYRYAEVVSVDTANLQAAVRYPGDIDPVIVKMGVFQPSVGQIVRIEGKLYDRFIADAYGVAATGTTQWNAFEWSEEGPSEVGEDEHPLYNPIGVALDIQSVRVAFFPGNGPVGADYMVQLNVSGSPAFTTEVTVPDGGITAIAAPDLITTWGASDYLTVERTQVGSTSPGTDVVITVTAL